MPTWATELDELLEQIVALEEQRRSVASDIKNILQSAADAGYSKKALRLLVKRALETDDQRADREAVQAAFDEMCAALGEFRDTPLGKAAVDFQEHVDRSGITATIAAGDKKTTISPRRQRTDPAFADFRSPEA